MAAFSRNEIFDVIDNAYEYKIHVIDFKTPDKFLSKKLKKYTQDDYERDLKKLKDFDINLLWNKSFHGIGVASSISACAAVPYSKLKRLIG